MVSLFAIYEKPANESEFLDHYKEIHMPLVKQMPGLLNASWGLVESLSHRDPAPYLVAEMRFSDRDSLQAAMRSPSGQKASEDLQQFAPGLVTMRVVQWNE